MTTKDKLINCPKCGKNVNPTEKVCKNCKGNLSTKQGSNLQQHSSKELKNEKVVKIIEALSEKASTIKDSVKTDYQNNGWPGVLKNKAIIVSGICSLIILLFTFKSEEPTVKHKTEPTQKKQELKVVSPNAAAPKETVSLVKKTVTPPIQSAKVSSKEIVVKKETVKELKQKPKAKSNKEAELLKKKAEDLAKINSFKSQKCENSELTLAEFLDKNLAKQEWSVVKSRFSFGTSIQLVAEINEPFSKQLKKLILDAVDSEKALYGVPSNIINLIKKVHFGKFESSHPMQSEFLESIEEKINALALKYQKQYPTIESVSLYEKREKEFRGKFYKELDELKEKTLNAVKELVDEIEKKSGDKLEIEYKREGIPFRRPGGYAAKKGLFSLYKWSHYTAKNFNKKDPDYIVKRRRNNYLENSVRPLQKRLNNKLEMFINPYAKEFEEMEKFMFKLKFNLERGGSYEECLQNAANDFRDEITKATQSEFTVKFIKEFIANKGDKLNIIWPEQLKKATSTNRSFRQYNTSRKTISTPLDYANKVSLESLDKLGVKDSVKAFLGKAIIKK